MVLSQKVGQGFGSYGLRSIQTNTLYAIKNIPWAMLYIMTHQPQVTSQNYKSNTQLGNNCKSKSHYNQNPKQ